MKLSSSLRVICFTFIFGCTATSVASEMVVSARAYSSSHCGYASSTLADFRFVYRNPQINPHISTANQLIVHLAFHDGNLNRYWQNEKAVTLTPRTAEGGANLDQVAWVAEVSQVEIGARGQFRFNFLESVVEIIGADGSHSFDNGGAGPYGHFAAAMSLNPTCEPGEWHSLTVHAFQAGDNREN